MDGISCMLDNSSIQKQIKSAVQPIGRMIYNEIYLYLWFICVYMVLLLVGVILNFYYLCRLRRGVVHNTCESNNV
jgi:hypothetical protein